MVSLAVGVVVAVDIPDFRQTKDGFQFLFERSLGLQIAKEYDRCRAMHTHSLDNEGKVSVYVTAKKDAIISHNSTTRPGLKSKFSAPL